MENLSVKLYLNMIIKDDEPVEVVKRCLDSVKSQVDGMFITVTYKDTPPESNNALLKLLRKYGVNITFFKWVYDFAAARNFAMEQVPKGPNVYIYWQDADDVLRAKVSLKQVAEEAYKGNVAAYFFVYFYMVDLDEDGNIRESLVEHKRERVIRNDGTFQWIGMLHETLIEQRQENIIKYGRDDCSVIHLTNNDRLDKNINRNIEILEKQATKENHMDPRTLVYLARAYLDKGKMQGDPAQQKIYFDLALTLFHEYLEGWGTPGTPNYSEGSGWPQERATAWAHVGEIAFLQGAIEPAIQAYQSAIDEAPEFPIYYVHLAMCYVSKGDFAKAKHWLTVATNVVEPNTTIITTPRDMKTRSLEVSYQIALHEMQLETAAKNLQLLLEIMPNEPTYVERLKGVRKMILDNKASQSIVFLGKYLEQTKENEKLGHLVQAIPVGLEEEKFAAEMRHLFLPPRKWEDNEIALLCGPGFETWSPKSIETGLGGSEEAVVYLSQELKKLGWRVTVYANPGKEAGDHDGVTYKLWHDLNVKDEFNVLILWRAIGFVDFKPKSKFTMVWMHDVPNNPDFTKERVDMVNKIAVLSEYHKSLLRMDTGNGFEAMPEKKVFLTANGITKIEVPQLARDPYRMIYSSSPDRGLVYLLKMWPEIIKEVPEANLHVFYGFNIFDSIHKGNPGRQKWKNTILEMMKQPGITYHGRVGHKQLQEEMAKSAIWAYPTDFTEISCITGMKTQALGAIPVCTILGALDETVRNGLKLNADIATEEAQKEFKDNLVKLLKNPQMQEEIRVPMMKWAQEYFTWDKVAQNWDQLLRINLQNPDNFFKKTGGDENVNAGLSTN